MALVVGLQGWIIYVQQLGKATAKSDSDAATKSRARQDEAIAIVHDAVNGGMAANKKEIAELKAEIVRLKAIEPTEAS